MRAEVLHHLLAGAAIDGLERIGFVVNAGMEHARIAAGLMSSQGVLFFEQRYVLVWVALAKGIGSGQPDNTAAHNEDFGFGHRWVL